MKGFLCTSTNFIKIWDHQVEFCTFLCWFNMEWPRCSQQWHNCWTHWKYFKRASWEYSKCKQGVIKKFRDRFCNSTRGRSSNTAFSLNSLKPLGTASRHSVERACVPVPCRISGHTQNVRKESNSTCASSFALNMGKTMQRFWNVKICFWLWMLKSCSHVWMVYKFKDYWTSVDDYPQSGQLSPCRNDDSVRCMWELIMQTSN